MHLANRGLRAEFAGARQLPVCSRCASLFVKCARDVQSSNIYIYTCLFSFRWFHDLRSAARVPFGGIIMVVRCRMAEYVFKHCNLRQCQIHRNNTTVVDPVVTSQVLLAQVKLLV